MDPGFAALISGIVGAAGGAFTAGRAAQATYNSALRAGVDNHAQWRRDLRRTAYADFAIGANRANKLLAAAWITQGDSNFEQIQASLPSAAADLDRASVLVDLEGPAALGEFAQALALEIATIAVQISDYQNEFDFHQAVKGVQAKTGQFIAAARDELELPSGTPTRRRRLRFLKADKDHMAQER